MKPMAALIMAAGASSRFGGCKLLADVGGRPMLQQRIDQAGEWLPEDVYVVSGAWHQALMAAKERGELSGASFLYADRWSDGLAASLVTGIHALEADYAAVLVLLADQVALERRDLARLLATFNQHNSDGHAIVCAFYQGRRGVPAIFGRKSFPRLKRLSGDQGAKAVLYESAFPVYECPLPNAALDIDYRDQLTPRNGYAWGH